MTAGLALLALFALANYAPDAVSWALHQSATAWDYVLQGVQSAVLWAWLAAYMPHIIARGACALGVWEAMQRPVFRLMFPMDRPPATGGVNLGEAVMGVPLVWINALAALFVALLAQELHRAQASAH